MDVCSDGNHEGGDDDDYINSGDSDDQSICNLFFNKCIILKHNLHSVVVCFRRA